MSELITEDALEAKIRGLPASHVKATDVSSGCGQKFEILVVSR
jgi:stress-induced morphogen